MAIGKSMTMMKSRKGRIRKDTKPKKERDQKRPKTYYRTIDIIELKNAPPEGAALGLRLAVVERKRGGASLR